MTQPKPPTGGLEGLAVLVTGGGTGIGRACAARLARDGAAVTLCGRTESKLRDAADAIAAEGGLVQVVAGDVTEEADVVRMVETATAFVGRLDGCVANAGGGGLPAPYHLQDTEEFLRVLHLNVLGTMLCVKHTVPAMRAAGGGSFVGMSSLAGHRTHLYFWAYPVSKAGIEQMMRNAADEYGPAKIRFNAVRPGFIATEMMEVIPRGGSTYASYLAQTPLDGVGEPEDVANLVRFLVGPEARWITGTVIDVDGGHQLRRGPDFGEFVPYTADVRQGKLP
jgi:NAD(P)-dependent dehydrogenase (short-subunit alcohol dehydrogenase family)